MAATAPASLPEVPYDAASGDIRRIYDAIAESLGVRLVNLAYRNLATTPGCLEWSWSVLGPGLRDGTFAREGRRLTDGGGAAPGLPTPSLRGLGPGGAAQVLRTIDAYNRANPVNAVALGALRLAVRDGRPAPPFRAPGTDGRKLDALPPIAALDALPAGTGDLLRRLALQTVGDGAAMVPSLFRHFTAWPEALAACSEIIGALGEGGRLEARTAEVARLAEGGARAVHAGAGRPGGGVRLQPGPADAVAATAETFIPAICRMVVIGGALRRNLRAD